MFVGSVDSLMGSKYVDPVLAVPDGRSVWALALDANATHMYMFSATSDGDGKWLAFYEVGYARQGASWVQTVEVAMPFSRVIGQVVLA